MSHFRVSEFERLVPIFGHAPVGLCQLSLEGRFQCVNDELSHMLGRSREELLRAGIAEVAHPEDAGSSVAAIARLIVTGHPESLDQRFIRPDRTSIWTNSTLTRVDDSLGHPESILVITIDLTSRRDADRRQQEHDDRLRLEQARAAAALSISEEKFRQVSDSEILSIAFFDAAGALTDANQTFLRKVDYTREDLSAGRLRWDDLSPPDWKLRAQEALEEFDATGRIQNHEREFLKGDGTRFWALFGGARLDENGHGVAFIVDITDRKRAEEALLLSELRLRRAIQVPTVGIVFFDLSGFVTEANEAFLQMSGYTAEDVLARRVRWDDMTPPEWRPHSRRAEEELKALGQTTPYEKQYIRKNGSRWWAQFAATRLSEEEGVEYVIDITERKATEEQLRRYKEDLEMRVQERTTELDSINGTLRQEIIERERAENARQELLRRLVTAEEEERRRISRELHDEIGQHLAALMLGLKSLDQPNNAPAVSSTLKMLQATTEIVGREIHELALELRPTSLDDLGLLRTLSNYVDQWSSRASVEVDFHSSGWTGDRLPPHIEATVYRIVQEALTNILKHARATRVSLIIERRPGQAIVIVEDNGAGFDDDRLMNRPNRNSIGLLGMRERAALIDGELKVEASLGKGTTVFLRIPLP